MKLIKLVLLSLLLVSCSTPWYTQYGMTNVNDLSQSRYASNLIAALDDDNANVRRNAIRYIALNESNMKKAEPKLQSLSATDPNRNVRREAQKNLALLNKKTATIIIENSACSGFSAMMPTGIEYFGANAGSSYQPRDFRPIDGDKVSVSYYQFEGKNRVLNVTPVDLVKNRFIEEGATVIGKLSPYNQWKNNKRYELLLKNGSKIAIDLLGARYIRGDGEPIETAGEFTAGAILKVKIKEHYPSLGSCYLYGVDTYSILPRKEL